jgi:hypothetical protein
MPQTYKEYDSIREVAISGFYGGVLPSGHERLVVGDIVVIRKPLGYCGTKEYQRFFWMKLSLVSDSARWDELNDIVADPDWQDNPAATFYDKRRFCIPLHRLVEVASFVDTARIIDPADNYQPFVGVDEDTGAFYNWRPALDADGLIWDKVLGGYIL